jgi:hypothetical protein
MRQCHGAGVLYFAEATITEPKMNSIKKALVVAMLCAAGGVQAAGQPVTDSAKAQYDAERARCMSGTTGQDQASCLRSAGAAYDSIKQNKLRDPNMQYHDNAMARCQSLPAGDRADCESRVDGGGDASGSVKGGGIIKETTTTLPASGR